MNMVGALTLEIYFPRSKNQCLAANVESVQFWNWNWWAIPIPILKFKKKGMGIDRFGLEIEVCYKKVKSTN